MNHNLTVETSSQPTSSEVREDKVEPSTGNISLINYYFLIQSDPEIGREFQVFRNESISVSSIILVNFLMTFLIYPQMITNVQQDATNEDVYALKIIEIIFTILSFICNWGFALVLARPQVLALWPIRNERFQRTLRSLAIVSITTALSFHLIRRGVSSDYSHDYLPIYQTHYESNHHSFEACPIWFMIIPIAMIVITREYRLSHVLFVFSLTLFTLVLAASFNHSILNYPNIIVYLIVGGLILFDCLRQQLSQFFRHRELLSRMLSQERSAEQIRRQEMRHMIANVAHDLKSPLASFINGIELIQADSNYLQKLLKGKTPEGSNLTTDEISNSLEAIASIISTTHYVHNINNFMLMTINRCLDTTKASNGLKLVPKNETIALLETLSLPIECLATTQQKIGIELIPWDLERISTCIITDKQWLQENILCLLSNAIKYSYEGKVTISVHLRPKRTFPNWDATYDNSGKDQKRLPACLQEQEDINSIASQTGVYSPAKPKQRNSSSSTSFGKLRRWVRRESHLSQSSSSGRTSLLSIFLPPKFKVTPEINTNNNHLSELSKNLPSIQFFSVRDKTTTENHLLSNQPSLPQNHSIISSHSLFHSHPNSHPVNNHIPDGDQEYLVFEIEDTGIGMTDQAREQLFNPFQQNQRLAGGTGLGLYSLAKRIEALKGYFGVEKRRDGMEGSLFWFAIPYHPDFVMEKVLTSRSPRHEFSPSDIPVNNSENQQELRRTPLSSPNRVMIQTPSPIQNSAMPRNSSFDIQRECTSASLPFPEMQNLSERRFNEVKTPTARLFDNLHTQNRSNFHQQQYRSSLTIDPSTVLGRASITAQDLAIAVASARDTLKQSLDSGQTLSYRILIADDTPTVAKIMKRLLERQGHEVDVVENGAAAVKVIQQTMEALTKQAEESRLQSSFEVCTPPHSVTASPRIVKGYDLLLMDLYMPIMDGLEATKRIRALEEEKNAVNADSGGPMFHQKIVCVSANNCEETVEAAYESGMDGFIPKPFTYEIFIDAVRSLFDVPH